MVTRQQAEKTLRLISRAWGRRQTGYVFFPWIDREQQRLSGSRRGGYHEGPDSKAPGFKWPQDRAKIVEHMISHGDHDLYWCPSLFEYNSRREDLAADEHALWADLDEVDPTLIDDYPPTIAWESSPGRYQALWLAASGDFQGASWPGNENQKLTYHLGADRSGWDTTQLLRVPGWTNHKPQYEKNGRYPKGKLLWSDGPQYQPGDFSELPQVAGMTGEVTDAIEVEIDQIDRHAVLARVKLKLTRRVREVLAAREVSGDRSDALWEMERGLADAGCSVAEIVAIVRETVWNKYVGRADEMRRLILEASKAIAAKPDEVDTDDHEEIDRTGPERLGNILRNVRRPKFLVDGIITKGAVGFIAGEPKTFKSWTALDLCISIATGAHFLNHFRVVEPGPVLYIQEEDPPTTLKTRTAKIWASKSVDTLKLVRDSEMLTVEWLPPEQDASFDPDIGAFIQRGVVVSDEAWQLWLDDILAEGLDGKPYVMVVIDTLMMVAGDVEENKSQAMTTKIFKPLKLLARKHDTALMVVHHMGKSEKPRMGQRMLGAVANHAWSEDSLYLSRAANGDVRIELESKSAPSMTWRMSNLGNMTWDPRIDLWARDEPAESTPTKPRGRKSTSVTKVVDVMASAGDAVTTTHLAEATGLSRSQIWRLLRRLEDEGQATNTIAPSGIQHWSLT